MFDLKTLARMGGKKPSRLKGRRLKPAKPSRRAEAAYRADLLQIVEHIRRVTRAVLFPAVKREAEMAARRSADTVQDDYFSAQVLMGAIEAMSVQLGGVQKIATRLATEAVRRAQEDTDKQLSANISSVLGINVESTIKALNVRPQIEAATVANAELIKSLPNQYTEKVKTLVLNNLQTGQRWESIAADIEKQLEVTENRAKLIARDQMSKVNSSLNETKQTALGITTYEWQTSGDERVRQSHVDNDGQVFKWADPPRGTGHPGHDINCRCVALPIIDLDE